MAVEHVGTVDFEEKVLRQTKPVLVDFWAPWCMPCRMFGPVLDKVAKETEGAAHVVKVNIDEEPELASRYGVMSIPTVLVFQNGQAVNRSVGVQTPAVVKAMLNV